MKILVTGASGFIGSFMAEEALRRGMDTWAGVRRSSSRAYLADERIRFAELDLEHPERLALQLERHKREHGGWDYVVHCAGATKCRRKEDFDRINHEATRHRVRRRTELAMGPRQFICISSLSVYGPGHEADYAPIGESDTPRPDTAYGRSKLLAERCLTDNAAPSFPYVIFRPTGVYGPRERDYYLMAKCVARGLDVAVGSRRQDLTFVYVKDLVQAVFRAIDRGVTRRAYFVSDGNTYSARTFGSLLARELGRRVVHVTLPLAVVRVVSVLAETLAGWAGRSSTLNRDKYNIMKQRNWRCDIRPLRDELGYVPGYDLERGVKETVAWYKQEGWL